MRQVRLDVRIPKWSSAERRYWTLPICSIGNTANGHEALRYVRTVAQFSWEFARVPMYDCGVAEHEFVSSFRARPPLKCLLAATSIRTDRSWNGPRTLIVEYLQGFYIVSSSSYPWQRTQCRTNYGQTYSTNHTYCLGQSSPIPMDRYYVLRALGFCSKPKLL